MARGADGSTVCTMVFTNRRDGGRRLATDLLPAPEDAVIVALPRGGVPVAYELAQALGAPLDILAVRKLGAPGNPEFGVGAIAEDGSSALDTHTAARVHMTQRILDETVARESQELRRRVARYREGRRPVPVRGRTAIIVDDGLATGLTDLAAVRAMRAQGAARVIVAAPVASPEAVALLGAEADEVVCHMVPDHFLGVGRFYEDFSPVSDGEVIALLDASGTSAPAPPRPMAERAVVLSLDGAELGGDLVVPRDARGLVLFAHGSGSSRRSPRNRAVAQDLNDAGFATLLMDLLTEDEARRRALVFDIPRLARRLELATSWAHGDPDTSGLTVGYFGASTGAGAALQAAAGRTDVAAIVSRGGRPDLAADHLGRVSAPTLLIVGGDDPQVLERNRQAGALLRCAHQIAIVPGARHLFEEPGALDAVTRLSVDWFTAHLGPGGPGPRAATAGEHR